MLIDYAFSFKAYFLLILLYSFRLLKYNGKQTIHRNRHAKNQPQYPISVNPFICPGCIPIARASNKTQILVPNTRIITISIIVSLSLPLKKNIFN